jgi:hypothetical protein
MHQSGSNVSALLFVLLASACSAAPADGEGALDDGNGAGVADTEQGIGEPACASVAADKTTNILPFSWPSPQVYDKPTCRKAAIVDARSIARPRKKEVAWADALPTNPDACKRAFLTSTFYVLVAGGYQQSGAPQNKNGVWLNGRCTGLVVDWSAKSDLAYRVVSSARVSADIAAPTRRLRVSAE